MASPQQLKTCSRGHRFYKSSNCSVCPHCEAARKPNNGFGALLSAPARRALEREKIATAEQLAARTEKELLSLHGMGKTAIPVLKKFLNALGLDFKK
ncbi:MAG: hypothetical protein EOO03_08705 [Chitinophagaceae bacterium]|nr:MAG: hypothetical protein EOO03_08705 [Chitinophagaceae bacterium]